MESQRSFRRYTSWLAVMAYAIGCTASTEDSHPPNLKSGALLGENGPAHPNSFTMLKLCGSEEEPLDCGTGSGFALSPDSLYVVIAGHMARDLENNDKIWGLAFYFPEHADKGEQSFLHLVKRDASGQIENPKITVHPSYPRTSLAKDYIATRTDLAVLRLRKSALTHVQGLKSLQLAQEPIQQNRTVRVDGFPVPPFKENVPRPVSTEMSFTKTNIQFYRRSRVTSFSIENKSILFTTPETNQLDNAAVSTYLREHGMQGPSIAPGDSGGLVYHANPCEEQRIYGLVVGAVHSPAITFWLKRFPGPFETLFTPEELNAFERAYNSLSLLDPDIETEALSIPLDRIVQFPASLLTSEVFLRLDGQTPEYNGLTTKQWLEQFQTAPQ